MEVKHFGRSLSKFERIGDIETREVSDICARLCSPYPRVSVIGQ